MVLILSARRPGAIGISGLVVEYIVAIDVTRVRFPADASFAVMDEVLMNIVRAHGQDAFF